jgi:putative transposase
VLDLYNGEIIAFETNKRPVFDLVNSMLKKALDKLGPQDKPMLHSDRGWHYRMPAFQRRLRDRQLVQSMSRKGNCLDNAAMESFFAVLKTEFFYLNKFRSVDELRDGLADYIRYYNHDRIKLKLKGLSPVQYRTQALVAQQTNRPTLWGQFRTWRFADLVVPCRQSGGRLPYFRTGTDAGTWR